MQRTLAACLMVGLVGSACSRGEPTIAPATAPPLQSSATGGASPQPLQTANGVTAGGPTGYSCSFPGANGQTILARFTIDGMNARDDEGTTFAVLTNSATAVVLARARDDVAAPQGDVGGYLVAIDRRDLTMVQSTVGVKSAAATRKGRCIAG